MGNPSLPASCRGCGQTYAMDLGTRDPLCAACREKVSAWHAPERLNSLAQQGFEVAMGMRPDPGLYPGLPADAGLTAQRWGEGTGMAAQQMLGYDDQGNPWISQDGWDAATGGEPVLDGQIRCRHCAAVLTEDPGGFWADPSNSAACPEIGIPHLPMPEGLAGGQ